MKVESVKAGTASSAEIEVAKTPLPTKKITDEDFSHLNHSGMEVVFKYGLMFVNRAPSDAEELVRLSVKGSSPSVGVIFIQMPKRMDAYIWTTFRGGKCIVHWLKADDMAQPNIKK